MSRRRVVRDGEYTWELEEPRPAHVHRRRYETQGFYGEFVQGGPGPVELGRRSSAAHKAREKQA